MPKPINITKRENERKVLPTARSQYRWVFWDWNGTLLDDCDYAISVRNRIFPSFGLPTVESVDDYHEQFTFPVKIYYERAGVTDENFIAVANAWMDEYMRGAESIPLHPDALVALHAFQDAGLSQVLLSASDKKVLFQQLSYYGIEPFFSAVLGLNHIYATSKLELGNTYISEHGIPPSECVLLGDTLHDAEVSNKMGIDCILIARGHQSEKALRMAGVPVLGQLTAAVKWMLPISP